MALSLGFVGFDAGRLAERLAGRLEDAGLKHCSSPGFEIYLIMNMTMINDSKTCSKHVHVMLLAILHAHGYISMISSSIIISDIN